VAGFGYILAANLQEGCGSAKQIYQEAVGMNALRRTGIAALMALCFSLCIAVSASAASLSLSPGEYFVDTSTLTLEDTGGPIATGVNEGGVAVFSFDSIAIPAGAEVFAEGSRPLELRSAGAFTLGGLIEASGFDAEREVAGPNPGGPGGGAGGANGSEAGAGPGGGGVGSEYFDGGGGGGFGGHGAMGGVGSSGTGGLGGSAYGDLAVALQGGSGGGGGTTSAHSPVVGGGGGGGAVELVADRLSIPASGEVFAEGGNGNGANYGASGGGSGGAIVLHANLLEVAGFLSAEGGDGGTGGCCGDGGGGGGGRIAYQYNQLVGEGEAVVAGGESGASGPFVSVHKSPEPTGAPGVVTKAQGPAATTSPATAIGLAGATLNGTVNPHGNATTYRFQLGTSTAYGTTVPVPDGAVGSDSSDHALSQAVTGLAPGTTYHYRIVASGLGFSVPGADMTFTTAPKCSGVAISKGRVKVKNGKAPIRLSTVGACKGDLALFMKAPPKGKAKGHGKGKASASKKKGKGGKSIQIGSGSFSLQAGQTTTIEIPLSAAALKRLSLGKALPATVKATATDGVDPQVTTQGNVSLKLAKKGKGPKKH
jgi:hypothetical protein